MTVTAKDLLQCCRAAVLDLCKLDDQLARCLPTGRPSGVKAQQYNADPPGTNDPTAAAIHLYEGLMTQRESLAQDVARISKTAWRIISTQGLICKGGIYPPIHHDCGSFVVNGCGYEERSSILPVTVD